MEVKPHFAWILPLNMIYMFGYQWRHKHVLTA